MSSSTFFFFNDTATTEIYTLSLHDALPIPRRPEAPGGPDRPAVVLPGAHGADQGTGRAGPGQRRDRRPAGSRGLPHAPPARTLPSRRDPAADPPAGPAVRPGPRPPHRSGRPRARP